MTNEPTEIRPEHIKALVDIANHNEAMMDGTTAPVLRIVADHEAVMAVWQDDTAPGGVGMLVVKGVELFKRALASGSPLPTKISAMKCTEAAQAMALAKVVAEDGTGPNRTQ